MGPTSDPAASPPASTARIRLVLLIGGPLLLLAAALLLLTPWGMTAALRLVLGAIPPAPGTRIEIASASGGLLQRLDVRGLRVLGRGDSVLVRIDTLRAEYHLAELIGPGHRARRVLLAGAWVDAAHWPPAEPRPRKDTTPPRFALDELEIRGGGAALRALPAARDSLWEVRDLAMRVRGLAFGDSGLSAALEHAALTGRPLADPPASFRVEARGQLTPTALRNSRVRIDGDSSHVVLEGTLGFPRKGGTFDGTDLRLSASPLAERDFRRYVAMDANPGDITLEATLQGTGARLAARGSARTTRGGALDFDAAHGGAPDAFGLRARARATRLDVGSIFGSARGTFVLDGTLDVDLAGPGREHMSGPLSLAFDGSTLMGRDFERGRIAGRMDRGRATLSADAISEGFVLHANGTAEPFASPPVADLSAALTIPPIDARGAAPVAGGPAWVAGDLSATLHARARSLAEGDGTLALVLTPDAGEAPLFGASRFDATLAKGVIRWTLAGDVSDGAVHAAGDVDVRGDVLAYTIRESEVRGVDLAPFVGDTLATRLTAAFTLEGRGTDPATARAGARFASLRVARGPHHLDADATELTLRDRKATLTTAALVDGASLDATASLAPLVDPRTQLQLEGRFRDLDLARVTGDTTYASDLAGTFEASARTSDLAALERAFSKGGATPGRGRSTARLALAPSTWRGRKVSRFDLAAALEGESARLDGQLTSEFGNASLEGRARPYDDPPSVHIEPLALSALDLGPLLGRRGLSTALTGRVTVDAAGRDAASYAAVFRAEFDGSRINATRFDRMNADARLTAGRLDGKVNARSRADTLTATFEGRDLGIRGGSPRFAARGHARSEDIGAWLGRDSLDATAALDFNVTAHGDPATGPGLNTFAGRMNGRGRVGGTVVDTLLGAFEGTPGHIQVTRLDLRSSAGNMTAGGRIALPRAARGDSTSFRLTGTLDDLQPLGRQLGFRTLRASSGGFSVVASGPPHDTKLNGEIHGTRIAVDDTRADTLNLVFTGSMRDSVLTALNAHLAVDGLLVGNMLSRDLTATGTWNGTEAAVEARADVDQGRWQEIAFRATPGTPRTRARLERLETLRQKTRLALQHPVDLEFGDRLAIHDLVLLQDGTPRLRANGTIDPAARADLTLAIDSLDVTDYIDLMGVQNLSGRLSLDAAVQGTPRQPVVDGTWRALLDAGGRPARLQGNTHWADGELRMQARFEQKPGQQLSWNTRIPATLDLAPPRGAPMVALRDAPMADTIAANAFDIAWFGPMLPPGSARDLKGRLDGRVVSTGSPLFPKVLGRLDLTAAAVQLPSLGTRYKTARVRLDFHERTITLAPATIESGKGRLEANGHATFEGRGQRSFELDTRLKRFPVINNAMATSEFNGTLTASGHTHAPRIRGSLELVNSTLRVGSGQSERQVEKVELTDADRAELEARFSEPVKAAEDPMALIDSTDVDVTTKIGQGVWVRRDTDPVVALELAGEVRTRKPPGGAITASGRIDVQTGRSYLSYLGRRFEMTHASVALPGPIDSASAELEARYEGEGSGKSAPEVTATVAVSSEGTKVDLRSVPYMDRAALINYLTTGETQGEMAAGTATGLAVGSVIGALGGSAGRSLGFQVVQVTQDAYGGQTLSAGNYVDPRIYLGFRQPVVQGQNTNTSSKQNTYTTEFEVELEMAKYLLFNVQGGGSQYRFLLRPRLGR